MEIILIKSYAEKPWRSPATYQLIEKSLKKEWSIKSIKTKNPENLHDFFIVRKERSESIFAFNIAEYLDEESKVGFLPALLDEWEIPHLGSSAQVIDIGLDKARTKDLLDKHNIPTPQYFVAQKGDLDINQRANRIGYPLIVKPIREGGHIGIRDDSIVYDESSLIRIVNRIFDVHHQPALIEAYITGNEMREFSVGIIDGKARLYTPIEIDFESMNLNQDILSYESAQNDLERTKLLQDEKMLIEIIDLSKKTFDAVGAQDYSRVDLRMDHNKCYVIEINIMPGLGLHSFLPEAAKNIHGIEYEQLILKLAENSMSRQKNGGKMKH
jgi:D-alanine-D-alanine ligase